MIPRYSHPEIAKIWTEERKVELWLEIELAVLQALEEEGVVPSKTADSIRQKGRVDLDRIREIERVTRHDVAAFVQSIEEVVGEEDGRWIHYGMTSSDVLDTTLALQLVEATNIILQDLLTLQDAVKARAIEHMMTPMIGRSHGIHAEPTTFGHMMALWYDELSRQIQRLKRAQEEVAYGKISGAIGTFSNISPTVETRVCELLNLQPAPVSTQVIQRDRHAALFSVFALIASTLEKFAVQIRHLQRTEVGEAEEEFHVGQKGSSAMPHKRNPVLSENVTGLARYVRGMLLPALEDVVLWHERDISHSSVERMICPDATVTLGFAIRRMTQIISKLVVYPERMRENLEQTGGLPFSQTILLTMIRKGLSRSEAYRRTQKVAMHAFENGKNFKSVAMRADEFLEILTPDELDACFNLEHALRHIPVIFERLFGPQESDA